MDNQNTQVQPRRFAWKPRIIGAAVGSIGPAGFFVLGQFDNGLHQGYPTLLYVVAILICWPTSKIFSFFGARFLIADHQGQGPGYALIPLLSVIVVNGLLASILALLVARLSKRSKKVDPYSFEPEKCMVSIRNRRVDEWMSRFFELVAFRHKHGHANVPAHGPKGLPLGQWLSFQRSRRDSLAISRRRLLDKAGIVWTPLETQWEEMFEKLVAYASVHGHCRVTDAQDRKLALWVANVRKRRKVTPLQKRRLDRIGFDWDVAASDWAHRMADLRRSQNGLDTRMFQFDGRKTKRSEAGLLICEAVAAKFLPPSNGNSRPLGLIGGHGAHNNGSGDFCNC